YFASSSGGSGWGKAWFLTYDTKKRASLISNARALKIPDKPIHLLIMGFWLYNIFMTVKWFCVCPMNRSMRFILRSMYYFLKRLHARIGFIHVVIQKVTSYQCHFSFSRFFCCNAFA